MRPNKAKTFWAWWCDMHGWEPTLYPSKRACGISPDYRWGCDGPKKHEHCGPRRVQIQEVTQGGQEKRR